MDDTYVRRKKNKNDILFNAFNSFHKNIKLTVEVNPTKFLDTQISRYPDGSLSFKVVQKKRKLPIYWTSAIPKQYKRNLIKGYLHRANRIGSDFELERSEIRQKYKRAGFPDRFIRSAFEQFDTPKDEDLILSWLFKNQRKLHFKVLYCPKNELYIHKCIDKLNSFTKNVITFLYSWITSKIRTLFSLKDKILHVHNVIYEWECSCGETYLGETKRNVEVRWAEHEAVKGISEPAKHISKNPTHKFSWRTLIRDPEDWKKRGY